MTAPDLSPAEAKIVARFDAAPTPPEVLREQVARAMYDSDTETHQLSTTYTWAEEARGIADAYRRLADAALAVFRGQQDPAVQRVCTCGAERYATWHKSNCGLTR